MHLYRKIDHLRQEQLQELFKGLRGLYVNDENGPFKLLSVSVFDHWLSRAEAEELLSDISKEEINRRNNLHFNLLKRIASETEVMSFRVSGRRKTKLLFREFGSKERCLDYFRPIDGKYSYQGRFWIALPDIGAIYLEGYDETNHLYYLNETLLKNFRYWVQEEELHILQH